MRLHMLSGFKNIRFSMLLFSYCFTPMPTKMKLHSAAVGRSESRCAKFPKLMQWSPSRAEAAEGSSAMRGDKRDQPTEDPPRSKGAPKAGNLGEGHWP